MQQLMLLILCAVAVKQNGKLEKMALQSCSNDIEFEIDLYILTSDNAGSIASCLQQKIKDLYLLCT